MSEAGGDDVGGRDVGGARNGGRFEAASAGSWCDRGRGVGSTGGDDAPFGGELAAAAGAAAEVAVTGVLDSRALLVALAALGKIGGDC